MQTEVAREEVNQARGKALERGTSEKQGGTSRKLQGIGTGSCVLLLRAFQSCHEVNTFPGDVGICVWLHLSLETVYQIESVSLSVDTPQQRERHKQGMGLSAVWRKDCSHLEVHSKFIWISGAEDIRQHLN